MKIKIRKVKGQKPALNILLYSVRFQQGFILLAVSSPQTFFTYKILYAQNSIENSFGPGRTTRYIHIYRHHLVNSLEHTIRVKNSTAGSASPNRHYPSWLGHLEIDLFDN